MNGKQSPLVRAAKRKSNKTGVLYTPEGHPYVYMWPADRKQLCLRDVPRQSVIEAAEWATKEGCPNKGMLSQMFALT